MFRTLLAAAVVYAWGHPSFDGHHPAPLDKPLQGFYDQINIAASDSRQALGVLNEARTMHYLDVLMQRLGGELHAFEQ